MGFESLALAAAARVLCFLATARARLSSSAISGLAFRAFDMARALTALVPSDGNPRAMHSALISAAFILLTGRILPKEQQSREIKQH